ncbi:MAG: hypothetical protein A3I88_01225 [Candidatus Portnoybacteria bacterium RIFCSPLOWO2_12_FULL_39_9]|uniref:Uncharacterized protein n=1 Tax=Candidatus Portnoybacteria bacterium RIFCSPHIGHO2_12_FULL_38_9 TaxID=1801997 RepID=A0A1G2FHH6_9BACT|nr:MAG: hypothetical protein A2646_00285 [Candidatus Portnoybacteria bacterium RIFCSPHIGHO2_02_FULL_39_12]OGZ37496.1 MAG: hypothetical protein A3J64_00710 [Candidatus Portnoybacteria bacterium RIFCSPHIGHO2_12_FULL_38_9]OGZ38394.1 MAG: hypothetical protein A3F21_02865 [Candidatus Portnoybacteria bacterium RIFCSPLOWO2_01_FULL_38_39]OGZ39837.1 MAG: hypothetical protein A3I88_01225 [Candidatus Portnoybacteria bacterium RIFCSPLOWO2_12_FULL_39_9]
MIYEALFIQNKPSLKPDKQFLFNRQIATEQYNTYTRPIVLALKYCKSKIVKDKSPPEQISNGENKVKR